MVVIQVISRGSRVLVVVVVCGEGGSLSSTQVEEDAQIGSHRVYGQVWKWLISLLLTFHWPDHSHSPNLTAKKAGKCSFPMYAGRESRMGEHPVSLRQSAL